MRGSVVRQARRAVPIYLLVAALVVLTLILSPTFRTQQNFRHVVTQVTPLAAVAVGQTIVLLLGGIDLSIGSVVSLATVILSFSGRNGSLNIWAALVLALAMGALVGFINGTGVVRLRVPPLLMTLGSMAVVKGAALYLRDAPGGSVDRTFTRFMNWSAGPVTMFGVGLVLLYLAAWAFLSFTRPGRHLYATGGDREHARRSGVNVDWTAILGYTLAGLVGAIGGILLAARIYSGDPVLGDAFSLDSVAAS
ncbi:MAG: ABC transporter permease, partial [Firmicutes bacterium]|nr:ABC transporter permease [Bacillota bacterium]